jgi:hypothetical protein
LRFGGETKWSPPFYFLIGISIMYPDLKLHLRANTEGDLHEYWIIQNNSGIEVEAEGRDLTGHLLWQGKHGQYTPHDEIEAIRDHEENWMLWEDERRVEAAFDSGEMGYKYGDAKEED